MEPALCVSLASQKIFGCRSEKYSVTMNKKRHHYIPKSYLRFFCEDAGQYVSIVRMIHTKLFRSRRTTQAFTSTITLSRSLMAGSRGDQSASLSFWVSDYLCAKGRAGTTRDVVSRHSFR